MTHTKSTYMALLAVLLSPTVAQADLIGVTIDGGITYAGGGYPNCVVTGPRIVGPGTEYSCSNSALNWFLDVGATTIDLTITNTRYPGSNIGNSTTIALTDLFWNGHPAGTITSVTGSPGASFTASTFSVTVHGATPQSDSYRWLLTGTSPVPEPGTLALLGIGLFALGLARRRKA